MADENDEIILADLSDDELVLQMHDDLYDGHMMRSCGQASCCQWAE